MLAQLFLDGADYILRMKLELLPEQPSRLHAVAIPGYQGQRKANQQNHTQAGRLRRSNKAASSPKPPWILFRPLPLSPARFPVNRYCARCRSIDFQRGCEARTTSSSVVSPRNAFFEAVIAQDCGNPAAPQYS